MIGTDSHTPNAGGLGMVAIGVGGADAVDVMAGFPFNVRWPEGHRRAPHRHAVGLVAPEGRHPRRSPGSSPSKGGTGAIVEYFGPGAESISATGKATICNMGAEIGATTLAVPVRRRTWPRYLKATGREAIADAADAVAEHLRADPEVDADPDASTTSVIEIDLDELEPHDRRPALPRPRPTGRASVGADGRGRTAGPLEISSALIGSCTNSSYEDITRAAHDRPRRPRPRGCAAKTPLLDHARLRAGARHHRARRPARRPRGDRRAPCSPTPAARASASGSAPTSTPASRTRSSTRTTATSRSATTATANTLASSTSPGHGDGAGARRARSTSTRRPTR